MEITDGRRINPATTPNRHWARTGPDGSGARAAGSPPAIAVCLEAAIWRPRSMQQSRPASLPKGGPAGMSCVNLACRGGGLVGRNLASGGSGRGGDNPLELSDREHPTECLVNHLPDCGRPLDALLLLVREDGDWP